MSHENISESFPAHYLRLDGFGRIVFDKCSSDHAHLVNPTDVSDERPTCRELLSQLIPADWHGRKGRWRVCITFEGEEP